MVVDCMCACTETQPLSPRLSVPPCLASDAFSDGSFGGTAGSMRRHARTHATSSPLQHTNKHTRACTNMHTPPPPSDTHSPIVHSLFSVSTSCAPHHTAASRALSHIHSLFYASSGCVPRSVSHIHSYMLLQVVWLFSTSCLTRSLFVICFLRLCSTLCLRVKLKSSISTREVP